MAILPTPKKPDLRQMRVSLKTRRKIKEAYEALMDTLQAGDLGRSIGHAKNLMMKVDEEFIRPKRSTDA